MSTAKATVTISFEYAQANFDPELTDEVVKDLVQDSILAHPELLYEAIDVEHSED